jgi:hypothetical protein
MVEPGYRLVSSTTIHGIEISKMVWLPDLKWQPGQDIPTTDPNHPPKICVGVGLKNRYFKQEEIPSIVSKLREAKDDVRLGEITIPKDALKEIAEEIDKLSKF